MALASGTAAIPLALLALGVGRGDEVLCSTFTFAGSAFPIELAEGCDAGRLVEAAQAAELPQAQRLGSLLDLVARSRPADPLARGAAPGLDAA